MPGATKPEGYQALYRSPAGMPEGYVRYRAKQTTDHMRHTGELTVDELVATTPAAYERLWRYCCEVDLVATLRAGDRSVDEPLGWLLEDARTVRQTGRYDFVWVRVLDVAGALSARRYAVDGHLVIEVSDDPGLRRRTLRIGWRARRERRARAPTRPPICRCRSTPWARCTPGGVSAHMLHDVGRIDEHRAGAVDRAAVMFRSSTAPWCSTWF